MMSVPLCWSGRAYAQAEPLPVTSGLFGVWNPLQQMSAVVPDGLLLHAAINEVDIGTGVKSTAWLLNVSLPSPYIRSRKGDRFRITLENSLPEALITWPCRTRCISTMSSFR